MTRTAVLGYRSPVRSLLGRRSCTTNWAPTASSSTPVTVSAPNAIRADRRRGTGDSTLPR